MLHPCIYAKMGCTFNLPCQFWYMGKINSNLFCGIVSVSVSSLIADMHKAITLPSRVCTHFPNKTFGTKPKPSNWAVDLINVPAWWANATQVNLGIPTRAIHYNTLPTIGPRKHDGYGHLSNRTMRNACLMRYCFGVFVHACLRCLRLRVCSVLTFSFDFLW